MKASLLLAALAVLTTGPALAETKVFELAPLPYGYGDLAPVIDATTMQTHYTKHHQAYVDKLNAEVEKTAELKGKSLEDILANVSKYNDAVRNNAGGHWNHTFFWTLMGPEANSGKPSSDLQQAIETSFGSVDKFKDAFNKAGADRFGSGWVWLIVGQDGKLAITSTPNQDNPLMDNASVKGTPILANDVWEHAYYLTYQNKRADYLKNWWKIVNWKQASENYANATASTSTGRN